MSLHKTERVIPAGKCPITALNDQEVKNFSKEFKELKKPEQENAFDHNPVKSKHKPQGSLYPSPTNILHPGRQLLRSPGPGILPPLPSQIFEPRAVRLGSFGELYKLITNNAVKITDNMVPSGKQLQRTPILTSHQESMTKSDVLKENQPLAKEKLSKTPAISKDSMACDKPATKPKAKVAHVEEREEISFEQQCAEPSLRKAKSEQENVDPEEEIHPDEIHKEAKDCENKSNRRISELPVHGLNRMRVSGLLKKMPGYQCRNEDLEFLKHLQNQEKAKALKDELLHLKKELAKANQEKEWTLAKNEKIEHDIHKMKMSYERTVQLGRVFLCRKQDPASVKDLPPEEVLKQLNPKSIQHVQQQACARLLAAQTELRRRKQIATNTISKVDDKLSLKSDSCNEHVKAAESRVQKLHEEVVDLKNQVTKVQKDIAVTEESLQKKRDHITQYDKQSTVSKQTSSKTEADREKLNRRLQRILHRKDLFLEREKILQRLNQGL
ncbi:uncharacterized protein LOC142491456 [Ascaphus truei]|uniref:uncharacterized protein LOC142491456 n=1 Tax=Ascaphus truei TaxID=8439 RepID=UPI003F59BD38